MNFFPYERFTIKTNLTSDQIQLILSDKIETVPMFLSSGLSYLVLSSGHKLFNGSINKNQFRFIPIINLRTPFGPRITGKITDGKNGALVEVTLTPAIFVSLSIFFFLGLSAFFFLAEVASWVLGNFPILHQPTFLQLSLMFALFYILFIGMFKIESTPSKKLLCKLLNSRQ